MRRAFTVDRVVARAPRRSHRPAPAGHQQRGHQPERPPGVVPAQRLAVVACMDCRVDIDLALGLRLGDAHVIRNAGASVDAAVLRSLEMSQELGTTGIVVLGHSDCRGIGDERPDDAVARAVDRIHHSKLRHTSAVRGFVLDLGTGKLWSVAT